VPGWLARDEAALSRLHAVLVAQSARGDDGYPRVLIEAHHKAVITGSDRRAFEALLDDALAGRGYRSLASAKERAKRRRAV
jgi:NurA-like 5'-3' nuclease